MGNGAMRMRRLDDLKLHVHDLSVRIEELEKGSEDKNSWGIMYLLQLREEYLQKIRFDGQRMVADAGAIDAWKKEHGEGKEA